jgi:ribosome recycling factor
VIDDALSEAKSKMAAAVEHARGELAKIRTGRANPGLVTDLLVDYYGSATPLQQLAGVSVPEARVLLITPYDPGALTEIERAIQAADLGVNPSDDGNVIRVVFPELSEERRNEYVKLARERAEEGRISVRTVRRQAKSDINELSDEGEVSQDEAYRGEGSLQNLTDKHVGEIDEMLARKERELLDF